MLSRSTRARWVLAIVSALVTLVLVAPAGATPPPTGSPSQVWQQTFGDEFNGVVLDPTKWTSCYWWVTGTGCTNSGNAELQWYTPANVVESHGTLKLHAQQQTLRAPDGKTYNYTSGMISTGRASSLLSTPPKYQFKYGYMEMRAKEPKGTGLWSAFWALPSGQGWPPEIDAMEMRGDRPSDNHMAVHTLNSSKQVVHTGAWWTGPDFTAGFHTFGMDWEPNAIVFYIDGAERYRVTDTSKIPNEPMYVLANLAVGGSWPGNPDASTKFPSDFEIDYIHVFQKVAKASPARR